YCPESRTRETGGIRLDLLRGGCEPFPEPAKQFGLRLEAILVEVVAGAPAGAEHEVPLEQSMLEQQSAERVECHRRLRHANASAAVARINSRSGDPGSSVVDEPSENPTATLSASLDEPRRRSSRTAAPARTASHSSLRIDDIRLAAPLFRRLRFVQPREARAQVVHHERGDDGLARGRDGYPTTRPHGVDRPGRPRHL